MCRIKLITFTGIKQIIGEKQIDFSAKSIDDLINKLIEKFGTVFSDELFDEEGKIKKIYRIVVNGRNINILDGFQTKLKDDDMVAIMPAIAGG
ncbi:MAG: MoaD family protein [Candidatus Heimdallarchaeota archaeon]|nr:MoaD family protein [Candidatus Heimdallarchaeota archaeon]MCK4877597.1 MoaD family protein [Candidatus Heimdallarchaeota archaeon]